MVVKKYVKALTSLSFVNPEKILDTFNELLKSSQFPEIIRPLYIYFYNNYIDPTSLRFPISLWNYHAHLNTNVPKTNNAIVGFHNAFNGMFGTSNYCLSLLVRKIKEEEENVQ
jgi:hypothetical protein